MNGNTLSNNRLQHQITKMKETSHHYEILHISLVVECWSDRPTLDVVVPSGVLLVSMTALIRSYRQIQEEIYTYGDLKSPPPFPDRSSYYFSIDHC